MLDTSSSSIVSTCDIQRCCMNCEASSKSRCKVYDAGTPHVPNRSAEIIGWPGLFYSTKASNKTRSNWVKRLAIRNLKTVPGNEHRQQRCRKLPAAQNIRSETTSGSRIRRFYLEDPQARKRSVRNWSAARVHRAAYFGSSYIVVNGGPFVGRHPPQALECRVIPSDDHASFSFPWASPTLYCAETDGICGCCARLVVQADPLLWSPPKYVGCLGSFRKPVVGCRVRRRCHIEGCRCHSHFEVVGMTPLSSSAVRFQCYCRPP